MSLTSMSKVMTTKSMRACLPPLQSTLQVQDLLSEYLANLVQILQPDQIVAKELRLTRSLYVTFPLLLMLYWSVIFRAIKYEVHS